MTVSDVVKCNTLYTGSLALIVAPFFEFKHIGILVFISSILQLCETNWQVSMFCRINHYETTDATA